MKPPLFNIINCVLLAALSGSGCITFYRETEEIGKKEERLNVDFETEHAA